RVQPGQETGGERETLEAERNYLVYLAACLGNFALPTGVLLLNEMIQNEGGPDAKAVARRRWRAVWALANLGGNLKRFDKLAPERQQAVAAQLEEEAAAGSERGRWADAALTWLRGRQTGSPHALGTDVALARCAGDPNPFLRATAALALNFWEGDAAENALMEKTLLRLAQDDGHGQELVAALHEDEEQAPGGVSKYPGLQIRYQATLALARRGSPKASLELLRDMLDEEAQRQNFQTR